MDSVLVVNVYFVYVIFVFVELCVMFGEESLVVKYKE